MSLGPWGLRRPTFGIGHQDSLDVVVQPNLQGAVGGLSQQGRGNTGRGGGAQKNMAILQYQSPTPRAQYTISHHHYKQELITLMGSCYKLPSKHNMTVAQQLL